MKLAVPDVERNDLARAGVEQHLRKTARRRADIEAYLILWREVRALSQCFHQLQCSAGDPGIIVDGETGEIVTVDPVAGLQCSPIEPNQTALDQISRARAAGNPASGNQLSVKAQPDGAGPDWTTV